ncbi:MAG: 2-hydroxychromene-2-carboxylate isomerase [Gammaproteobacteria bacterium]|nr:2-hydroxychromene-2-carboxylate isomerase [Gammaproteobacteria bacterium]
MEHESEIKTETVDYYWSFRSHYCYLSIDRVMELPREFAVNIRLRPVLPLILRTPKYFTSLPDTGVNRWSYIQKDTERIAERLGLSFGWPDPDPVAFVPGEFKPAAEQPHIHRLNRIAVAAAQHGKELEVTAALARVIFAPQPGWENPERIRATIESVGLNYEGLMNDIESNASRLDAEIDTNAEALAAAGHWGVPTLVFRGETFFGQDRIEDLRWRMQQQGL